MSQLETEIIDISDDALDDLFNDATPNANTLIGAKKNKVPVKKEEPIEEDVEEEEAPPVKKAKPKATPVQQSNNIENIDIDTFDDDEEIEEEEEEVVEEEEEEEEEEIDEEEEKKKAALAATAKKGTKRAENPAATQSAPEVLSVLKSTADYLVESGIWQDFDGREDMEMNEEVYAKLVAQQDQIRLEAMFNELVDSTGPFGKAIIDFVKNGGSPDEIIDLFKEQKQVDAIKIDNIDGQKDLIKQYYTEVMGWKPEKVDKFIGNLVLQNELEPEATEVKELYGKFYTKETERLNAERAEFTEKQKEAEKVFETNIKTAIKSRKDLSLAEKGLLENHILSYDQRLPNGNTVNKFYVNFSKMQQNPDDYLDLVLFVNDKQKYNQKISTTESTKAAAKAFSFIKGNGTDNKKKGSGYEQLKKNEKVSSFDWGMSK